jgi:spore coat protein U-like protein
MNINKTVATLALAMVAALGCNAAFAAEDTGTLTVSANLLTACEVSAASAINFGNFAALASSGDRTANSGSSFQVACSADASPSIYASGSRIMLNGASQLPFNLSLTSGAAADDLPSDSGSSTALTVAQDGDLHDVVLYAKAFAADYKALPSGAYTADVTVAVVY